LVSSTSFRCLYTHKTWHDVPYRVIHTPTASAIQSLIAYPRYEMWGMKGGFSERGEIYYSGIIDILQVPRDKGVMRSRAI
jgi:hypothetical protein